MDYFRRIKRSSKACGPSIPRPYLGNSGAAGSGKTKSFDVIEYYMLQKGVDPF